MLLVKRMQTKTRKRLRAALRPLLGSITVEAMRRANYAVDRADNKLGFDAAARQLAGE